MKKILLLVFIVSIWLRFSGITSGYPPYHPDEGMSYSQGIYILLDQTLDARGYSLRYAYPGLIPMIHAFVYKLIFLPGSWYLYYINHLGDFIDGIMKFPLTELETKRILSNHILGVREINVLIWGRFLTAVFGVGVLSLSYKLARKLYSQKTAIVTALFVAVNYRLVLNSHLTLPDMYNSFFLLCSMIFSLRIVKFPTMKDYAIAGLFVGLSLSTKFHVYAVFPFLVAHWNVIVGKKGFFLKSFVDRKVIISGLIALCVLVIINPYHFVNIETTIDQIYNVSLKYRSGKNSLDFFPYSYLYHLGLGSITSIMVLIGIVAVRSKKVFFAKVYLLSAIIPFLIVITYMTGGGFYTRNFVTITPLLLILAASVVELIPQHNMKKIWVYGIILLVFLASWENLSRSMVVIKEYRETWNFKIVSDWVNSSLEEESVIAAHPSVPFDNNKFQRIPYHQEKLFSIEEFRQEDADYAVLNTDYATQDFYGWMTKDTKTSLSYWNKPIYLLEETYSALSIREFQNYVIFSELNSYLAPDSSYVVAVIPKIFVNNKKLIKEYDLNKDNVIGFRSWRSEIFSVSEWQGITIKYSGYKKDSLDREGFVFVEYYSTKEDSVAGTNRVAVRLSSRMDSNEQNDYEFSHLIPPMGNFARVSVGVYKEAQSEVYFDKVLIYRSEVTEDYGGWEPHTVELETDLVFPNSHGNL